MTSGRYSFEWGVLSVLLLVDAVVESEDVDVPVLSDDLILVEEEWVLPLDGGWDIPGGKDGEEGEWNCTGKCGDLGEADERKGELR